MKRTSQDMEEPAARTSEVNDPRSDRSVAMREEGNERRSWLFAALGFAALACVWIGPMPRIAERAFFGHMTMHMVVVAIAAPLLAFGIAATRIDPVRKWPAMFPPVPISMLEFAVVWAWHAPALHHAARHHAGALVVEQALFLLCGVLIWLSAFGGDPAQRGQRIGAGVAALLLTSMHMTLLGALLALAPRPLYSHAVEFALLAPLDDQHLGGAIMLLIGGIAYLAGALWLTVELLGGAASRKEART